MNFENVLTKPIFWRFIFVVVERRRVAVGTSKAPAVPNLKELQFLIAEQTCFNP
jgi:hypothetical protein